MTSDSNLVPEEQKQQWKCLNVNKCKRFCRYTYFISCLPNIWMLKATGFIHTYIYICKVIHITVMPQRLQRENGWKLLFYI